MYEAEDMLADAEDWLSVNGQKLRKGSVAAAIANAKVIQDSHHNKNTQTQWASLIKISKQVLEPLGFYEVLSWNNKEIQDRCVSG